MAMVAARLSWLIVDQRFICVGQVFPRFGGDRGLKIVPDAFYWGREGYARTVPPLCA